MGKVVHFAATCTTKSASAMTFASIADPALYPVAVTPLNARIVAGADYTKRVMAHVTGKDIIATSFTNYSSTQGIALVGNIFVVGSWIIK